MDKKQSCEEIEPLISAYFDNELTEKDRLKIEYHLHTCQSCNIKLQSIEKISQLLKSSEEKLRRKIPSLSEEVMDRLCKENPIYCRHAVEQANDFISGKLCFKQHCLIQEHLNICPECNQKYQQLEV